MKKMKKILSVILTLSMLMSTAVFNVTNVSAAVTHGEYTPIDISSKFNAKGYLSQESAGTYQAGDESLAYPHFFKNSGGTATSPMAISSEAVSALAPDGIATLDGVPYYLSAPADGANGVLKCASQEIYVPRGYYRAVKLLGVYNPTGGGDNTFYNDYYVVGGGKVTATKTEKTVGNIARARVLTTDTEPSNINLIEFTFTFNDKTQEINMVKVWQQAETQIRVLAVTMEGLKGTEWNPIIAQKIAALPDISEHTISNYSIL